jgi:hypothetical protein
MNGGRSFATRSPFKKNYEIAKAIIICNIALEAIRIVIDFS